MKVVLIVFLAFVIAGCQSGDKGGKITTLESQQDKVSYAIGLNVGTNMLRDSVRYNVAPLMQGLQDAALDTAQRLMKPSEVEQTLMAYQEELREKAMEMRRKQGEAGKKRSDDFLEQNKNKAGVITLESGLQYKVIKEGTGPKPTMDDYLVAHYRGTLSDGSEFESSYNRGEPATFKLTNVIKGWQQAFQMMKVGSKWELYIPADLAYGEAGSGPIGPNEALIFEVELLDIKK